MSRTHKDVPPHHRKPREIYDWNWDVEKINLGPGYPLFWYKQLPSTKTKKRKEVDCEWHWMSTPSWWTRITMNRPQRRFYHLLEHKALMSDLEDFDFPDLKKKPHIYYW